MRRTLYLTIAVIILLSSTMLCTADTIVQTKSHTIEIASGPEGLLTEENIHIKNNAIVNITTIDLHIQDDRTDVAIFVGETEIAPSIANDIYALNLTTYGIAFEPEGTLSIKLTYTLPMATENVFEKTLVYDTTFFTVTFNEKEIYRSENLLKDTKINLLLYRPSETPLDLTIILIVFAVIVLIIIATLALLRRQRGKVKKSIVESKELLEIKKAHLMESLKDIEKKHRAQNISDDTYSKLKEEYKQNAVDVMKKLEDLK